MPDISIVMPVWNNYKPLDRAIESIMNQWFKNDKLSLEIIMIDDGSTDRLTKRKLKEWNRRLKNGQELLHISTLLLTHLQNKGISCARNSGISKSSGEYICYLDCDDVYYPHALETYYESLTKYSDSEVCFGGIDFIGWDAAKGEQMQEVISGFVPNAAMCVMHSRDCITDDDLFYPGLIERETEMFTNNLILKHTPVRVINIGKAIISATGQSIQKRLPNNGQGITYEGYRKKE